MSRNATALATTAAAPAVLANAKSMIQTKPRLDAISRRIDDEFQTAVINQAAQIAAADPNNFNIDSFTTTWKQQVDGRRNKTEAVESFWVELNNVVAIYAREHEEELLGAVRAEREALHSKLDTSSEDNAALKRQIEQLDDFIAGVRGYQIQKRPSPIEQLKEDIGKQLELNERETAAVVETIVQATKDNREAIARLQQGLEQCVASIQQVQAPANGQRAGAKKASAKPVAGKAVAGKAAAGKAGAPKAGATKRRNTAGKK
jgi:hypothetical protein